MQTRMHSADSLLGPMVSLRSLQTTVWRRRRIWLLTALLGLIYRIQSSPCASA